MSQSWETRPTRTIEALCSVVDTQRGYTFTMARGFSEYACGRQPKPPTDYRDFERIALHMESRPLCFIDLGAPVVNDDGSITIPSDVI